MQHVLQQVYPEYTRTSLDSSKELPASLVNSATKYSVHSELWFIKYTLYSAYEYTRPASLGDALRHYLQ